MNTKGFDLRTIQDVIHYWRHECIEQLPGHTKQEIASWIVGASTFATGDFDTWYNDEDFMNIYEDALSLETTPSYQIVDIASYWNGMEEDLAKLEERYLSQS